MPRKVAVDVDVGINFDVDGDAAVDVDGDAAVDVGKLHSLKKRL